MKTSQQVDGPKHKHVWRLTIIAQGKNPRKPPIPLSAVKWKSSGIFYTFWFLEEKEAEKWRSYFASKKDFLVFWFLKEKIKA
jgi:hypothetical protein